MNPRRHLAAALALALAALAPGPARADDSAAGEACGTLLQLLYWLPPPTYERPLALEVLTDTEFDLGPGTVLTSPGTEPRIGAELRLAVGIPRSGFELVASGGWLAPVLGSGGALRAGLGFDASWDLGGLSLYLLATDGAYATGDGVATPGALAILPEWRFAMGFRVPVGAGAIVAEWDTSALGWLGEAGGPIFGLRVGWAFGGRAAAPLPPCVGPNGLPTGRACRAR